MKEKVKGEEDKDGVKSSVHGWMCGWWMHVSVLDQG